MNKKVIKQIIIIAVIALMGYVVWLWGIKPLRKDVDGNWCYYVHDKGKYDYTVYIDRVEMNKFLPYYEKGYPTYKTIVEVPAELWGRPVVSIGEKCFNGYLAEEITLPDSIEIIDDQAFEDCTVERIIGGKNVKYIGRRAFGCANQLKDLGEIGKSVEIIGPNAFGGTWSLTTFPDMNKLTMVGTNAFSDSQIKEMGKMPNLTYMGRWIFPNTPYEEKHTEEFVICEGMLVGYNGAGGEVRIPEGVKGISTQFEESGTYYIPSTVKYLPPWCFEAPEDCTIEVYIPKEVERIGEEEKSPVMTDARFIAPITFGIEEYEKELFVHDGEGCVIVTTKGSYAEGYAKEMGYEVRIVEEW